MGPPPGVDRPRAPELTAQAGDSVTPQGAAQFGDVCCLGHRNHIDAAARARSWFDDDLDIAIQGQQETEQPVNGETGQAAA